MVTQAKVHSGGWVDVGGLHTAHSPRFGKLEKSRAVFVGAYCELPPVREGKVNTRYGIEEERGNWSDANNLMEDTLEDIAAKRRIHEVTKGSSFMVGDKMHIGTELYYRALDRILQGVPTGAPLPYYVPVGDVHTIDSCTGMKYGSAGHIRAMKEQHIYQEGNKHSVPTDKTNKGLNLFEWLGWSKGEESAEEESRTEEENESLFAHVKGSGWLGVL